MSGMLGVFGFVFLAVVRRSFRWSSLAILRVLAASGLLDVLLLRRLVGGAGGGRFTSSEVFA